MQHRFRLIVLLAFFACLYTHTSNAQNYARYSEIEEGMRNERLEQEAVYRANKKASSIKCRETYRVAKITSADWILEHNQYGNLTGRHLHMELYGKTYDGRCGATHFIFRQRLRGDNSFAPKLSIAEMGDFYDLVCE